MEKEKCTIMKVDYEKAHESINWDLSNAIKIEILWEMDQVDKGFLRTIYNNNFNQW